MKKTRPIVFILLNCLLALLFSSCEQEEFYDFDEYPEEDPSTRFSTAKNLSNSLLRQINLAADLQNSNSIKYPFCIYTVKIPRNAQTENNVLSWATTAMNTWIAPLVGQSGWKVKKAEAYNVQRNSSGCPSTHNGLRVYTIEISDLDGANNTCPGFLMHMGNWGVAKLAVLHEMGHGIGMGDTYTYSGGIHTPIGQPTSTMKDAWSHNGVLQKDDIDGIRFLWSRIRGENRPCPDGYVESECRGSSCNYAYFCVPGGDGGGGGAGGVTGECAQANENYAAQLSCPSGQTIRGISFASYGTPTGTCSSGFSTSSCHSSNSKSKVEGACLNKRSCSVNANNSFFGDPCPGTYKKLAIKFTCSGGSGGGDGGSGGGDGGDNLYEAEDFTAKYGVNLQSKHKGFSGNGFMDYGGNGTWIEWDNVRAPQAGQYKLIFRYAVDSSAHRQAEAIINGAGQGNIGFANTGAWTSWKTDSIVVTLRKGDNKIRIRANTNNGGPNLDKMTIEQK